MSPTQLPSSGFHYGVKFADYQAWDAINISSLKSMRRSALHCRHAMDNPRVATDAMVLGSALHIACFEPAQFESEFVLAEKFDRRTKEGKADFELFQQSLNGRTALQPADNQLVRGIVAAAIHGCKSAEKFFKMAGQCEVSALWQDPETKLMCKGRFDKHVSRDSGTPVPPIIVELKSTKDASDFWFSKDIAKFGYSAQASFYQWGHKVITGNLPLHVIIAVENTPPHAVAVYTLGDASLQTGALEFRSWLNRYAACKKSGVWPGYPDEVQVLEMPRWANEIEIES